MISRRKFIKKSTIAAAASAAVTSPLSPLLVKDADASVSALSSMLSIDPITLQYIVGSSCCWYCPDDLWVTHYQPVAFVEVLKSPADSIIPGAKLLGTATGGLFGRTAVAQRDDQVFSTRIWDLPDWAIDMAMAYQSCKLCGKGSARGASNVGNSLLSKAKDFVCPGSTTLTTSAMNKLNNMIPSCYPKLLYDTTIDPDWRFGCRDIGKGALSMSACMPGVKQLDIGGKAGEFFGIDPPCLGTWGPTYPRQMRVANSDPRIAAAVMAVRAVSVASDIGLFPYRKTFSSSRLQMVHPQPRIGTTPGSALGTTNIKTVPVMPAGGSYGFVWWTRVGCCKDISEIFGACAPKLPCT